MSRSRRARDLDAAIGNMPQSHMYCRDFGHAWEPHTAHLIRGGGVDQVLRCGRCHSTRHRVLDRRGEQVTSNYDYVDGYLIEGVGRLTGSDRGLLRLASATAMIQTARPSKEARSA